MKDSSAQAYWVVKACPEGRRKTPHGRRKRERAVSPTPTTILVAQSPRLFLDPSESNSNRSISSTTSNLSLRKVLFTAIRHYQSITISRLCQNGILRVQRQCQPSNLRIRLYQQASVGDHKGQLLGPSTSSDASTINPVRQIQNNPRIRIDSAGRCVPECNDAHPDPHNRASRSNAQRHVSRLCRIGGRRLGHWTRQSRVYSYRRSSSDHPHDLFRE